MQDLGGIKADRLRVKVTREGQSAGSKYKVGGQIGFKRRDGTWNNYWIDLMFDAPVNVAKGDVLHVSGRITFDEYNGKTQYVVWGATMANEPRQEPQASKPREFPGPGGLDDVPF